MSSSPSDPSTLSNALGTGDFGEVAQIKCPGLLVAPACTPKFPKKDKHSHKQRYLT